MVSILTEMSIFCLLNLAGLNNLASEPGGGLSLAYLENTFPRFLVISHISLRFHQYFDCLLNAFGLVKLCILCSFGWDRFALNTKVSYDKVNYWLRIDLIGNAFLYTFIVHVQIKVETLCTCTSALLSFRFLYKITLFPQWPKWHHSCSRSHSFLFWIASCPLKIAPFFIKVST